MVHPSASIFVVDYVVQPQMCGDCHRVEAKDFWKAVVPSGKR